MPPRNLSRTQNAALVIRTYHWQRRQHCAVFCNFILPPLTLVLLSVINNAVRPSPETILPFEQKPQSAFAPRPFDPAICTKDETMRDPIAREACAAMPFQPPYRVPVHISSGNNSTLVERFSLDPFAYPPAVDESSSFFEEQTPYDGVLLHGSFEGERNNSVYQAIVNASFAGRVDDLYDTSTISISSRDSLLTTLFDDWKRGPGFAPYSTALSFDTISQSQDSLSLSATLFYNESASTNCTEFCQLPSSLVRTYAAIYSAINAGHSAVAYLRRMPRVDSFESLGIIPLIFSILLAQLTHFLFPTFLRFLVLERSSRLRAMMASMGLPRRRYWIGTYLSLYLIYCVSVLIILIIGSIMRLPFFTMNTPLSYLVLFIIWGNVLVAMSMALEPFFGSAETAQIIGWFFIIITNLVGAPFIGRRLSDEDTSEGTWAAIMLLPTFAYMRSIYYAGALNSGGEGVTLRPTMYRDVQLGMCSGRGPFCRSYVFLIVEWVVLMVLAAYFGRVLPTAMGTRKHPLFFIGFKRKVEVVSSDGGDDDEEESNKKGGNNEEVGDVREEERRAEELIASRDGMEPFDGVVLHKLSKTYPGRPAVHALKQLSLVAKRNDVLCLLAHNGAGKTTAFRTLTGELEATGGDATIAGHSIVRDLDGVHRQLGVAAQQDILWWELTVEEHLYFYGRVKNVTGDALRDMVNEALDAVQLEYARKRKVRALSGGMRRRLSVSIAMMGEPSCILLDEPSTGLDLLAREKLWQAIGRLRRGKVVLLTTHSLEEAETLSTRVAIMSQGELRCIGTPEDLKVRLGRGHRLSVSVSERRGVGDVHGAVREVVPGAVVDAVVGGSVEYVLPRGFAVAPVLRMIGERREELGIRDWGITESSLEDVFMRVTKDSRAKKGMRGGIDADADASGMEEP